MRGIIELLAFVFIFTMALTMGVKAMLVKETAPETAAAVSGANQSNIILPQISTTTLSQISAGATALVYIDEGGGEHSLFQENVDAPMLIASISKLLTAVVASENISETSLVISKSVLQKRGAMKKFSANSSYSTDALYKALLVESNNDAGWVFAETLGADKFISKLNEKAKAIGMSWASFGNPIGIDPSSDYKGNYASVNDLVVLAKYINDNYPKIFEITSAKDVVITDSAGKNTYIASSTNKLLTDDALPITIIGGKTGETAESGKNLLLVFKKDPFPGYFISAILKSKDNFRDAKMLADAIHSADR